MLTINSVKQTNKKAGGFWFSPATMSFFETVIESELIDDLYFITSEVDPSERKRFSVRKVIDEGEDIETVGEFHSYRTLNEAEAAIESMDS